MRDWQTRRLADLCQIEIGRTPPRREARYWDPDKATENVWLSIGDLPSERPLNVADSKEYISDAGAALCRKVPAGTLLVSFKLSLGRLGLPEREVYTNEAIAALAVRDRSTLLREYLAWYLTWFDWDEAAKGEDKIKGKTLNKRKLAELSVLLPPPAEQRRIVAILDEAFAAIDDATASAVATLRYTAELLQSAIDEVCSHSSGVGASVFLEEITTSITDGDHSPPPKAEAGIPFVTIGCIDKETRTIDFTKAFSVPEAYYDSLKANRRPEPGDILYTVTGSYGVPVLVVSSRSFCFQRHIGLIRPQPQVRSKWLYYQLLTSSIARQAESSATGAAQKTVGLRALRSFQVPLHSGDEQERIASILDEVARHVKAARATRLAKLAALTELKQSILFKAFTGQLTSNTADELLPL